jgi:hypothetical protein
VNWEVLACMALTSWKLSTKLNCDDSKRLSHDILSLLTSSIFWAQNMSNSPRNARVVCVCGH